jgi:hypothetical protein
MNPTDTQEFGIPSLSSLRARAHRRELVSPPPYPGLRQRAVSSQLYARLARLVSFDA